MGPKHGSLAHLYPFGWGADDTVSRAVGLAFRLGEGPGTALHELLQQVREPVGLRLHQWRNPWIDRVDLDFQDEIVHMGDETRSWGRAYTTRIRAHVTIRVALQIDPVDASGAGASADEAIADAYLNALESAGLPSRGSCVEVSLPQAALAALADIADGRPPAYGAGLRAVEAWQRDRAKVPVSWVGAVADPLGAAGRARWGTRLAALHFNRSLPQSAAAAWALQARRACGVALSADWSIVALGPGPGPQDRAHAWRFLRRIDLT